MLSRKLAVVPASQEVHPSLVVLPFQVVLPFLEVLPSQEACQVPQMEAFPWEDAFLEACPLDLQVACPLVPPLEDP